MGSKMGKREKAVFLEEAEGKRASSKVSLSKMILRMVGILLGIIRNRNVLYEKESGPAVIPDTGTV